VIIAFTILFIHERASVNAKVHDVALFGTYYSINDIKAAIANGTINGSNSDLVLAYKQMYE
jgi:hypothetical protein